MTVTNIKQFETVELPLVPIGNRRGFTRQQIQDQPWIADFIMAFPHSFEADETRQCVLFIDPRSPNKADIT